MVNRGVTEMVSHGVLGMCQTIWSASTVGESKCDGRRERAKQIRHRKHGGCFDP